jgi:hypothetical protein
MVAAVVRFTMVIVILLQFRELKMWLGQPSEKCGMGGARPS